MMLHKPDRRFAYHHESRRITRRPRNDFQPQQLSKFLSMFEVELIETAHTGQQDAIVKLPHVVPCLLDDGRIDRSWIIPFEREGLEGYEALG